MIRFALVIAGFLAALPAWAQTDIREVTSPGGITAWLVEEPSIPFVALELRFRGGTSLDAPGKRGATSLMVGLLEEGAGDLDAQGFARATEALAAQFGFDGSDDGVSVSARFLTENRDEAVELLRLSLVEPRFSQVALDRVRAQVLSGIRSRATDPDKIAGARMDALLFGDHPYGSDPAGTIESVSALTREDMIAAHRGALARDRLYVSAVGDITAEDLGPLLDRLLGDLPETGAPMPAPVAPGFTGGVEVVQFDTPQSVAVFAQPGMDQDDPDFFAAYLLNTVLGGGGFKSRLMSEVREKRGLTYGVYSYLVPKDLANLYMGSVSSANDRIGEAIGVIRAEWARMAEAGVTEKELGDAKALLTGAYPLRFDGNGAIARILVGMQVDGMPIDYAVTRNDRMNAVTLEDVNRVARELLDPEAMMFVVVGKPEGV
ncbi:M16 family metallopeptidase [Thiosulfatihalobacter marinus]|jgi:zinc protease|uniref:M16 family metallopeptidase n=1 Tax=Thiosulfatihalobacter marinus TaxID=2792481 RepID=UPI0018D6640A|nr:pitrilysin family protein [Thiosulfatihalobacter marinus]